METVDISGFARSRMERFGLTEDQVKFVIGHHDHTYQPNRDVVYRTTLPDGRGAKVRLRNGQVVDVLTYR